MKFVLVLPVVYGIVLVLGRAGTSHGETQSQEEILGFLDELDRLAVTTPKSDETNKKGHFCTFYVPHKIRVSREFRRRTIKSFQVACRQGEIAQRCTQYRVVFEPTVHDLTRTVLRKVHRCCDGWKGINCNQRVDSLSQKRQFSDLESFTYTPKEFKCLEVNVTIKYDNVTITRNQAIAEMRQIAGEARAELHMCPDVTVRLRDVHIRDRINVTSIIAVFYLQSKLPPSTSLSSIDTDCIKESGIFMDLKAIPERIAPKFNGHPAIAVFVTYDTNGLCCDEGLVESSGICVPCAAGSYHDLHAGRCIGCDENTYQPQSGQISCLACPDGMVADGGVNATKCSRTCSPSCLNNGLCSDGFCFCPSGYTGKACEQAVCVPTCLNGGFCSKPNQCACLSGWTGPRCSKALCSSPCENGGICLAPDTCNCRPGYSGPTCKTDFCHPTCSNGGTCLAGNCSCAPGWNGDRCETALCINGCANHGTCIAPEKCACAPGFTGSQCQLGLSFCSGLPDGDYKDPNNCHGYISCSDGLTNHKDCPTGLRYNYTINQCDWPANVQCNQDVIDVKWKTILSDAILPGATNEPDLCFSWRSHIKTFDGRFIYFPGRCTYKLIHDCEDDLFSVHVFTDPLCKNLTNCRRSVNLYLGGLDIKISLGERDQVTVANKSVSLPHVVNSVVIEKVSNYVITYGYNGMTVLWDGIDAVYVHVSANHKNKTCGLCGNYNGLPDDDIVTYRRQQVSSIAKFGNSWRMTDIFHVCPDVGEDETRNPCDMLTQGNRTKIKGICSFLRNATFYPCHGVLDPAPFIRMCEKELCRCNLTDRFDCACSAFTQYSRACARNKVAIQWRTTDLCPVTCPKTQQFTECASSCPPTCQIKNRNYICPQRCLDVCHCGNGTVYDGQRCVTVQQCPCIHNKKHHPPNSVIRRDCNNCTCANGRWLCTNRQCPGVCSASGDPHYRTFDGLEFSFMGRCQYILAKDCVNNSFTILAENAECGSDGLVSCTKNVYVHLNGTAIILGGGGTVLINGNRVANFPLVTHSYIIKQLSSSMTSVYSPVGVSVKWDGISRVYVRVQPRFRDMTCGLCGTFNGKQKDDFTTKEDVVETSVTAFGNSWKVGPACNDTQPLKHPCEVQIQRKAAAERLCNRLLQSPFSSCHHTVDPSNGYIASCMYDVCGCQQGAQCLCTAIAAYVHDCARHGVVIDWINSKSIPECNAICPITGQVHQVCGSSCQRTCREISMDLPCEEECVEGCNCPKGMALTENDRCVPHAQCPCSLDGHHYTPGTVIRPSNCKECVCWDGRFNCTQKACKACHPGQKRVSCGAQCAKTCENFHLSCLETKCQEGCICPEGTVLHGQRCINSSQCPCHYGGHSYRPGQQIKVDCKTCSCKGTQWSCTSNVCPGTCSVYGELNYITFDGRRYPFNGACDYVLAQDSCDGTSPVTFQIQAQNVPCGSSGVTCTKEVIITLNNTVVTLEREKDPVISARPGAAALNIVERFQIRELHFFTMLETGFGLTVTWDRGTRLYITLDPKFKGRTCGLCGNFNDDRNDDFMTPQLSPEALATDFGDSWKVETSCPNASIPKDPCVKNKHRVPWAHKMCSVIRSDVFKPCHGFVNPISWYDACYRDACACDSGGDCECLCTAIASYGHECCKHGVPIKWRTQELCPIQCPSEDGHCFEYTPCDAGCPRTCENQCEANPARCPVQFEGCSCPNGTVLHDGKCISPRSCPCSVDGIDYEPGSIVVMNCQRCSCEAGCFSCTGPTCTSSATQSTWTTHSQQAVAHVTIPSSVLAAPQATTTSSFLMVAPLHSTAKAIFSTASSRIKVTTTSLIAVQHEKVTMLSLIKASRSTVPSVISPRVTRSSKPVMQPSVPHSKVTRTYLLAATLSEMTNHPLTAASPAKATHGSLTAQRSLNETETFLPRASSSKERASLIPKPLPRKSKSSLPAGVTSNRTVLGLLGGLSSEVMGDLLSAVPVSSTPVVSPLKVLTGSLTSTRTEELRVSSPTSAPSTKKIATSLQAAPTTKDILIPEASLAKVRTSPLKATQLLRSSLPAPQPPKSSEVIESSPRAAQPSKGIATSLSVTSTTKGTEGFLTSAPSVKGTVIFLSAALTTKVGASPQLIASPSKVRSSSSLAISPTKKRNWSLSAAQPSKETVISLPEAQAAMTTGNAHTLRQSSMVTASSLPETSFTKMTTSTPKLLTFSKAAISSRKTAILEKETTSTQEAPQKLSTNEPQESTSNKVAASTRPAASSSLVTVHSLPLEVPGKMTRSALVPAPQTNTTGSSLPQTQKLTATSLTAVVTSTVQSILPPKAPSKILEKSSPLLASPTSISSAITIKPSVLTSIKPQNTSVVHITPLQCPSDRVYTPCKSNCDESCQYMNNTCRKTLVTQCVPGCKCPGGTVFNGTSCVNPADCICFHKGKYYDPGATWNDTCDRCWCWNNSVICRPVRCPPQLVPCPNNSMSLILPGECCQSCVLPKNETKCIAPEYKCRDNSKCITKHWVCDGENDCKDGEDERKCTISISPCFESLGLSDRAPDHSFAASSSVSVYYRPSEGRLHNTHVEGKGSGAWCPNPNDTVPYLQVQLDSLQKVTAVSTQGHPALHKWVTLFRMSYSRNGVTWTKIEKTFYANTNQTFVVTNKLPQPVNALYLRVYPVQSHLGPCLRLEFYGCTIGVNVPPVCPEVRCDNGKCINPENVCDGRDDCGDGSDEMTCTSSAPCTEFHCDNNTKCISFRSLCDGHMDCLDGQDETQCPTTAGVTRPLISATLQVTAKVTTLVSTINRSSPSKTTTPPLTTEIMSSTSEVMTPVSKMTSPVSVMMSPVSEIMLPVSVMMSPVSEIMLPVSKMTSPVSKMASPVSKIMSSVSEMMSPVSEIMLPMSTMMSPVSKMMLPVTEMQALPTQARAKLSAVSLAESIKIVITPSTLSVGTTVVSKKECGDHCNCYMNCQRQITCPYSANCPSCICDNGTLKRQNRCVLPMPTPCMPPCDINGHKFQFGTTIHDGACRVCTCERKPDTLDQSTAVCQTTCTTVTLKSGTGNNLIISVENTMATSLSTSASGMLQLGGKETARPPNQAQRLKTSVTVPTQQSLPESKIEGLTATSSSKEFNTIKVGGLIVTRPSEGSATTITTASTTKAAEAKISRAESTVSVLNSSPTSAIANKRLKTTKKTGTTSVVPAKEGSEAILISPTTTIHSQKSATIKVASGIVLISSVKESMTTLTVRSLVSRIPTRESANKSFSPTSNLSSKKSVKTWISSPTRTLSSEKSAKTTIERGTSPTTTISTQQATIRKAASWTKATISTLESRTTPNETTSTTTLAMEESATQTFARPTGPTFTTFKLKLSATPKVSSPTLEISALGSYETTTARTLNPTVATIIPTFTPVCQWSNCTCTRTCVDLAELEVIPCTNDSCKPGCICPPGLVTHGNACVSAVLGCPCYHNQKFYKMGEQFQNGTCSTCMCFGDRVVCQSTCNIKTCPADKELIDEPGKCCYCRKKPSLSVVSSLTTLSKPTALTALPKSTSFAQTSSEPGTKHLGSARGIPTVSPSTMATPKVESVTLPVLPKGTSVAQISVKPGTKNLTTTRGIPAVSLSKMVRPNAEPTISTVLPKSTSIPQTSPKPVTTKPTTNIQPVTKTSEAEAAISRCNITSKSRSIADQSGCSSTHPIQQTACQGSCDSSAVLNITSPWVDIECLCCKPKNFSIANVSMNCPDGSYKVLKYLVIAECSCETCDSHAYQRRLQTAVGFLQGNMTEITDDNTFN